MSRPRYGAALTGPRNPAVRPVGAALCLLTAIAAGGCQTTQRSEREWAMRAVGAPVAPAVAAYVPKPEMEADGLPSQAPPPMRRQPGPDDPTEPFSPNYGTVRVKMPVAPPEEMTPPAAPAAQPAARPPIPSDLPPKFRRQLAAAINP
jgi:hypothetical protein